MTFSDIRLKTEFFTFLTDTQTHMLMNDTEKTTNKETQAKTKNKEFDSCASSETVYNDIFLHNRQRKSLCIGSICLCIGSILVLCLMTWASTAAQYIEAHLK